MGTRNPARVHIWEIATGKETAADLVKRKWYVRWRCDTCHTAILFDILALAERHPGAQLWNWHPRCRSMRGDWRCTGHVTFQVMAHPAMGWVDMISSSFMRGSLAQPTLRDPVSGRPEPPLPDGPS